MSKKHNKPAISGMDAELAAHVKNMKVASWEIRRDSKSHVKLYIRCEPVQPEVRIGVM